MTVGEPDRDEELARALQEEFRKEVEQLASPSTWSQVQGVFSAPSSGGSSSSAPRSGNSGSGGQHTPRQKKPSSNYSSPDTVATAPIGTPSPERAYTRGDDPWSSFDSHKQQQQKQTQKQTEKQSKQSTPRNSSRGQPRSSPRGSPRISPQSSPRGSPRGSPRISFSISTFLADDTAGDEAVARRLEQQLRDEDLAVRLAQAERASASFSVDRIPLGNVSTLSSDAFVKTPPRGVCRRRGMGEEPPSDCRGKAIFYGLRAGLAILVAGITFLVWVTAFGSRTGSDALDPAAWLPGFPDSDPGLGSVGEHNVWKPLDDEDMTGLTLTILNNLKSGSDWNEHLQSSIYEWDNGTPDAVNLNIRTTAYDPDCRAVRRAMKVCNANYGPTDWRGVNQILLQDEYIITSLAKMNDYYLEGTNYAQKQYTMCHELGHGLGLGHSDENFHNKDLGNCMDYTERPQNNMHPDTSNFITLEELYGNVDGTVMVQRERVPDGRSLSDQDELSSAAFDIYASYLLDPIEVLGDDNAGLHPNGEWRLLRRTDTVEYHERKLGNGYSILTSILLV